MANYSTKWLKVSEPFPHVLHIELARPPVNAFSIEFWREYGKLFDSLTYDGYDVRAAVLSSALPKIFTAGVDRMGCIVFQDTLNIKVYFAVTGFGDSGLGSGEDSARVIFQTRKIIDEFHHIVMSPERAPFPVIVALHGHVLGLGVDLIGACDIRYAASNTSFSIKEVDIGVSPHMGTLAFLPKITGNSSLVHELSYTGRPFSASESEKLGVVSRVIEGGRLEVIKAALELAKLIANKSSVAVASAKHLICHSRDHTVAENLSYTSVWNAAALMTRDIPEAVARKQIPNFRPLTVQAKLYKL